ncbi:unnamed protein product [Adineta ricciae]|uniref:Uncharacterized protein n=1 Tax=Adineta ricciae TaxID=249248 RepID=A0A814JWH1_ADIRI|nr:unnamed protein product [Adineta ricciae]
MKLQWPICGPKLSLCCSIISVWGIVQFLLMGVFFYMEAAPLLDDFEFDHNTTNTKVFRDNLSSAYNQRAHNCWIAAFLYVGLLVIAGSQFMTNQKQLVETGQPTSMAPRFSDLAADENGFNRQYQMQYNSEQTE